MTEHNIFLSLFSHNCDQFLQSLFLELDPASIKHCRSVCRQWNTFIKRRLWNSRVGRRKLGVKLHSFWRNEQSKIRSFAYSKRIVYCIESDDKAVYCGTVDGFTEIYNIETRELEYELCCRDSRYHSKEGTGVQFSVGVKVIATLTESGNICIWDKQTFALEYQARHHGDGVGVCGIKVFDTKVTTGASDGKIFVLEKADKQWIIRTKVDINNEEIIHIDIDQGWLVSGTDSSIKVWNHSELKDGPRQCSIDLVPVPWMFLLRFPFIFVVGGEKWQGFQVWNVDTNKRIRYFQLEEKMFHTLSSNGDFIVFCEIAMLYPGDAPVKVAVLVFDINELCDETIADENLWRRERLCLQNFEDGEVNAAINQTNLLVAHGHVVDIQSFWMIN